MPAEYFNGLFWSLGALSALGILSGMVLIMLLILEVKRQIDERK